MKKLIHGIVEFRQKVRASYKDTFARLALGQRPDALFIACSDSRVAPNLFASTDPGDLFVIRNVGNLIPPCGEAGHSASDESEAAAIEFALTHLPVTEMIVCGHSECGAMVSLAQGRAEVAASNLRSWLRHGDVSLRQLDAGERCVGSHLERHNQLSQLNVLEQLEHLKTYPMVAERLQKGQLRLHAWWFDIKEAEVYEYDPSEGRFRVIDEEFAALIISRSGELNGPKGE